MSALAPHWTSDDLAALRRAAGLTQAQVAARLGCRRQRVQAVEAARSVTDCTAARTLLAIAELRAAAVTPLAPDTEAARPRRPRAAQDAREP